LTIPFEAITAFADPAVKFGLQFQAVPLESLEADEEPAAEPDAETPKPADKPDGSGQVVTLDAFRKK
jgi:hypothetical protein